MDHPGRAARAREIRFYTETRVATTDTEARKRFRRYWTIAVGMILVYLLDAAAPQLLHFDIKPTYLIGVALGGVIFGGGFALGGYCPGTCVVGASEGRRDARYAILGGAVGALLFAMLSTVLLDPVIKPLDLGKVRVQDYVHLPAVVVALVVAGVLLTTVRLLPTTRGTPR